MLPAMRGLDVPEVGEDFTADQVELYFDLAFVFAFAQLVAYLHSEHTMRSIAAAGLLFVMLWLSWSQFTWSANAISSSARPVRTLFLIATIVVMPMSASVASAYGDSGFLFGVAMSVIYLLALLPMYVASPDIPGLRASIVRYSIPNLVALVVIFFASFLDPASRTIGWIVGLLIMGYSIVRAGEGEWIVRPGHFAERHGLIVIIALGEVIVAIGAPLVAKFSAGEPIATDTRLAVLLSGLFAAFLWWAYFDRPAPAFEWASEQLEERKERGRFSRDVYTVSHTFIVFGVILAAAGLEEITLHPADPLEGAFKAMLAIGIAGYLLGIGAAVWRSFRVIARERLIGLTVILAVMYGLPDLSGLVLLAVLNAILLVVLIFEQVRVEGSQHDDESSAETVDDDESADADSESG